MASLPHPHEHDHQHCIADALATADRVCSRNGGRLTAIRRRVLEIVWASHRPVGAYDILETLSAERGRVAPPTVYRALDFLVGQGLVHRIDRLNAFIGCPHPDEPHSSAFLLCRCCGEVAELAAGELDTALAGIAQASGFRVESRTVELAGLCRNCAASEAAGSRP
ncbi:Fur family transcriptional regulator [Geminicoccus flavidas]|uniref:Fur family transcriptional regulator n=1 Tax=Geminicoccus flavidas TaxID=2506407 RepID=UPI001357CBE6|nr:Fur family transcriptional regulator [Geminicoccus flavidas]